MSAIEMFRSLLAAQSSAGRGIAPAAAPLALQLARQLTIDAGERDALAAALERARAQIETTRATPTPRISAAAAGGSRGARLGPDAFFDAAGLHGPARAMLTRFRRTLAAEAKRDPAAFRARVERERLAEQAEQARLRTRMRAECAAGLATLGNGAADWYRELARRGYGPAEPHGFEHGPAYRPDRLPELPPEIPAGARERGAA